MRRTPLLDLDARVSVDELQRSSPWDSLQAGLLAATARWTPAALSAFLQRRATLHLSVLALASAVVAGSALAGQRSEAYVQPAPFAEGSDSLAASAHTAIVARSLPSGQDVYTVQPGDTLTSIARQTGVGEEALLAFNGYTSSDVLNVGLRLRIPDLSTVPAERLRIKDTAPHDSTPLVGDLPLPPQKPAPELTIHEVQK